MQRVRVGRTLRSKTGLGPLMRLSVSLHGCLESERSGAEQSAMSQSPHQPQSPLTS